MARRKHRASPLSGFIVEPAAPVGGNATWRLPGNAERCAAACLHLRRVLGRAAPSTIQYRIYGVVSRFLPYGGRDSATICTRRRYTPLSLPRNSPRAASRVHYTGYTASNAPALFIAQRRSSYRGIAARGAARRHAARRNDARHRGCLLASLNGVRAPPPAAFYRTLRAAVASTASLHHLFTAL